MSPLKVCLLYPLGFSPLWCEPRSGHMWDGWSGLLFTRVLRFLPTFDERSSRYKWNIFERAVKPKSKKKKKKKVYLFLLKTFPFDTVIVTQFMRPCIELFYTVYPPIYSDRWRNKMIYKRPIHFHFDRMYSNEYKVFLCHGRGVKRSTLFACTIPRLTPCSVSEITNIWKIGIYL